MFSFCAPHNSKVSSAACAAHSDTPDDRGERVGEECMRHGFRRGGQWRGMRAPLAGMEDVQRGHGGAGGDHLGDGALAVARAKLDGP